MELTVIVSTHLVGEVIGRVATHAGPHPVAPTLAAVSQEMISHSAVALMTLFLMVIPSMAASHNVQETTIAQMTTVVNPPNV